MKMCLFIYFLKKGAECDGHVHHQLERIGPYVLLFQFATGHFALLPPGVDSRRCSLRPLSAHALRSSGRLHLHRSRYYAQSLHHDRPPETLPKVSAPTAAIPTSFLPLPIAQQLYTTNGRHCYNSAVQEQ